MSQAKKRLQKEFYEETMKHITEEINNKWQKVWTKKEAPITTLTLIQRTQIFHKP